MSERSQTARGETVRVAPARPQGTPNLANLLRDPLLLITELVAARVADAGFGDLRPAHLAVFQHGAPGGSRITEIAERAQLAKPSIVYLVNDLEALGYVERVADPTDGRARLVRLTTRGREAQEAGRDGIARIEAEWAELLGAERLALLRELLIELHAGLWPPDPPDR